MTSSSTVSVLPHTIRCLLRRFDGNAVAEEKWTASSCEKLEFAGGVWHVNFQTQARSSTDALRCLGKAVLLSGQAENVALSLVIELTAWSKDHYLLFPGLIYAGNRFPILPKQYPPIFDQPYNTGPDTLPLLTEVLKLNHEAGPSGFSIKAGAMAVPNISIFDPRTRHGLHILTSPFSNARENGYEFSENDQRTSARLLVSTPGVRVPFRYTMCNPRTPSEDRGANLVPGDSLELEAEITASACSSIDELFQQQLAKRYALTGNPSLTPQFPFCAAWELLEQKHNTGNWNPEEQYYAVGMREDRFQDLQIGWTGGLINTLPLLHEGGETSRQRAQATIDFVFAHGGLGASGFFHGIYHRGEWSGDGFDENQWTPQARPHPDRNHYHLLRKSADALYFLIKHYDLLQKRDPQWRIPEAWARGTQTCADAFVKLWKENGQLGQFIDIHTGAIIAGGTPSAALAIGGLALAARFFGKPAYLETAKEIAVSFESLFTNQGITTGGPGEILQCPDSESAFALLESYTVLWEETLDPHWLAAAEKAAAQAASWQMNYDYAFPAESTFGRLGMKSAGAVFANTQNGHGAPAICTLSGDAYLKLYRATGKPIYRQLLQELAHNLTQYLSRSDRPILASNGKTLPPGWMNERVNTGDWDDNLGGVFYGSTWAEVSLMLTCMEVPGVHLRLDTGEAHCYDHVLARPILEKGAVTAFEIKNPTAFPARVKLLIENGDQIRLPLRQNALWNTPVIPLAPQQSLQFRIRGTKIEPL